MTASTPASTAPPPSPEQPGPRRWWALGVLSVGLAMIVMDGTIVAVSLPTIIDDLHLDLTDAQWVNSLYSVILAALLLTCAALGDRFGRRKLFIVGILLFVGAERDDGQHPETEGGQRRDRGCPASDLGQHRRDLADPESGTA